MKWPSLVRMEITYATKLHNLIQFDNKFPRHQNMFQDRKCPNGTKAAVRQELRQMMRIADNVDILTRQDIKPRIEPRFRNQIFSQSC